MTVYRSDGTSFVEVDTVSASDGTTFSDAVVYRSDGTSFTQIWPSGAGATIVDSFEDQDLAEYGGDTGVYSIVSTNATDGTYALRNDNNGVIQSTTGLNNYISQGDTARYDWHLTESGAAFGFLLFTQDETSTPEGYMIRPNDVDDFFQIYRVDSGTFNLLDESAVSLTLDATYTVEMRPTTSGINADLLDSGDSIIASVTTTDTTYTTGGIGWRSGGTTSATVDFVRIT